MVWFKILFWLAFVSAGAGVAFADADGPDFYRVVGVASNDVLNIRSEPIASAPKIGSIPPGADGVRNLGCEGGLSFAEWEVASPAERDAARHNRWCRIAYGGVEGWVTGRFLAEGSGGGAGAGWKVTGVASNDVLNVRADPSGNAGIVGALSPYETGIENLGCQVPPGSSTQWCRISIHGFEGWVAGRFLAQE
jgi:uncharacterized protein YraI